MKHPILLLSLLAGAAHAQGIDLKTPPKADPCDPIKAQSIKRTDHTNGKTVLFRYAGTNGKLCSLVVNKTDAKPGVPDRIELGRQKTIAGHSGTPPR